MVHLSHGEGRGLPSKPLSWSICAHLGFFWQLLRGETLAGGRMVHQRHQNMLKSLLSSVIASTPWNASRVNLTSVQEKAIKENEKWLREILLWSNEECLSMRIYFEPQAITLLSPKICTDSPEVNEGFPKNNYSKSLFRGKAERIKSSFLFFRDALSGKHDDYMMSCHSATAHSVLLLLAPAPLTFSHLSYPLYSWHPGIIKCPLQHTAILALRVQADLISLCFTGI